jgi:hypothetical protein
VLVEQRIYFCRNDVTKYGSDRDQQHPPSWIPSAIPTLIAHNQAIYQLCMPLLVLFGGAFQIEHCLRRDGQETAPLSTRGSNNTKNIVIKGPLYGRFGAQLFVTQPADRSSRPRI